MKMTNDEARRRASAVKKMTVSRLLSGSRCTDFNFASQCIEEIYRRIELGELAWREAMAARGRLRPSGVNVCQYGLAARNAKAKYADAREALNVFVDKHRDPPAAEGSDGNAG